jgi:hypothetical protein
MFLFACSVLASIHPKIDYGFLVGAPQEAAEETNEPCLFPMGKFKP